MIIEDLRDATVMRNLATVMNTNTDTYSTSHAWTPVHRLAGVQKVQLS